MKLNKYIYVVIIIFTICLLNSCTKIKEIEDSNEFIDLVYGWSSGTLKDSCLIDLRELRNEATLDDYDSGHISGAKSYDFGNDNKEKFITWITGLYNKKTTFLLIDSGHNEYLTIIEYLKEAGYSKIYAYKYGYANLKESSDFKNKIVESTGIEDCGC